MTTKRSKSLSSILEAAIENHQTNDPTKDLDDTYIEDYASSMLNVQLKGREVEMLGRAIPAYLAAQTDNERLSAMEDIRSLDEYLGFGDVEDEA